MRGSMIPVEDNNNTTSTNSSTTGVGGKQPPKVTSPSIGRVTHHNVEIVMLRDLDVVADSKHKKSICLQQQDKHGGWYTVYTLVLALRLHIVRAPRYARSLSRSHDHIAHQRVSVVVVVVIVSVIVIIVEVVVVVVVVVLIVIILVVIVVVIVIIIVLVVVVVVVVVVVDVVVVVGGGG